jgi:hypothetical protein
MSLEIDPTPRQESNEINSVPKRIFISADHGTSVIYFLQSHVVPALNRAFCFVNV